MYGSATFAMVESSACINVPAIEHSMTILSSNLLS